MPEGGGRIEDTTLFGKYQLCRILGRGRSGTVYLARHKDLEEYRAIKQVPKTCADYDQFRKEALILKGVRHPGIPIVYDLEEDEEYSYLIEEFLEGDSLYALISDVGHFSKAMTIRYGIQICRLVNILHSARPNPILYLDLQPKNLLICHDTVKLIDFDHAVPLEEVDKLTLRYGTIGCAAPEQYTGEPLDERTDIFAIGAVLHYMMTGKYAKSGPVLSLTVRDSADRQVARIIRTCLLTDKTKRYGSAEQLCEELLRVQGELLRKGKRKKQGNSGDDPISSLTIAAAGTRPGVGTTHIAMGMTAYLRQCGIMAMYEEQNDSGAIRQFGAACGSRADSWGLLKIRGVPMLPYYGETVKLAKPPYQVVVQDYGSDWQMLLQQQADLYLLICGAKPWEWETARDAMISLGTHPGLAVIYNHFCGQLCDRLSGPAKETSCFLMPYDSNPLRCGKAASSVYAAVLQQIFGHRSGGLLRSLSGKGREFITRVFSKQNKQ
ncbi:MAG: serine/threonine-protein kinase [Lachnospiraceae bacterium]|nr:serine/threonine-protein kinase [Lachnospiraceae bacterium]